MVIHRGNSMGRGFTTILLSDGPGLCTRELSTMDEGCLRVVETDIGSA